MRLRQVKQRHNLGEEKRKRRAESEALIARETERHLRHEESEGLKRARQYLYRSEQRLKLERYVTAMWGCKTSWAKVEAHGKYYAYYSKRSGPRAERPERGGDWHFQARAPLRAPLAA